MSEPKSREGTMFGPYRLLRLIGKGGMGEVYEAEDTVKDRIVALKLLPEGVSHDPVFRKRLQREAHSAGRLQEPHVVPIHDYGEIDGVLFVDMRMITGSDLRKLLKSSGPMPPARAVAIIRQVASALDAAHEAGIMHRDVKPENIVVTREDFAYLVDFGIANAANDEKLTEMGTAVGTYAYMAPERFQSGEVTYRADIYALTCVLHECLTGAQPYGGDSVGVVITGHLMQPIPRPSVERPGIPTTFDQVVARGMAKQPQDRYASAVELAMAATQALTELDKGRAETAARRRRAPRSDRALPWPRRYLLPHRVTRRRGPPHRRTDWRPHRRVHRGMGSADRPRRVRIRRAARSFRGSPPQPLGACCSWRQRPSASSWRSTLAMTATPAAPAPAHARRPRPPTARRRAPGRRSANGPRPQTIRVRSPRG